MLLDIDELINLLEELRDAETERRRLDEEFRVAAKYGHGEEAREYAYNAARAQEAKVSSLRIKLTKSKARDRLARFQYMPLMSEIKGQNDFANAGHLDDLRWSARRIKDHWTDGATHIDLRAYKKTGGFAPEIPTLRLKGLNKNIEYAAKDLDGRVHLFTEMPRKHTYEPVWLGRHCGFGNVDSCARNAICATQFRVLKPLNWAESLHKITHN